MIRSSLIVTLLVLLTAACSKIPHEAYNNSSGPERLLDVSSERVNVSLASNTASDQLIEWLNEDQPSRAEIYCRNMSDDMCIQAQTILDQFAVPFDLYVDGIDQVALVYERIIARDCSAGFVSNHVNPYNLPSPGFGCSNAVNMLQMISDKQSLVSPALTDYQDAQKAITALEVYSEPSNEVLDFQQLFDGQ